MKTHRSLLPMAALAICIIMLTGCWDAKELDDLAIPIVIAYDRILEEEKQYPDDEYLVTAEVPVFYGDVKEKIHSVSTTGNIIGEARGRRNSHLGERTIFGQLQLLLLGHELAKERDILELIDILVRNPKVKASIYMIVVKGRGVDLIKSPVRNYPNMGTYLKALIENSKDTNFYPYTTMFQFNRCLISYQTSALLPHIVFGNGEVMLAGSCLINEGKAAGEMGREETETAVMLRGIKCRGTLSFKVKKDGKVVDEATFEGRNSRKVTVKVLEDRYVFNILIKLSGVIVEHKRQVPMQDGEELTEVFRESLEQHIKERAEALVEKTQKEFKFDALCLANYIKAHTREKLTKKDIDRIVQEADINVDVRVQIRNTGGKM